MIVLLSANTLLYSGCKRQYGHVFGAMFDMWKGTFVIVIETIGEPANEYELRCARGLVIDKDGRPHVGYFKYFQKELIE